MQNKVHLVFSIRTSRRPSEMDLTPDYINCYGAQDADFSADWCVLLCLQRVEKVHLGCVIIGSQLWFMLMHTKQFSSLSTTGMIHMCTGV
jgi:hypothetical protein